MQKIIQKKQTRVREEDKRQEDKIQQILQNLKKEEKMRKQMLMTKLEIKGKEL